MIRFLALLFLSTIFAATLVQSRSARRCSASSPDVVCYQEPRNSGRQSDEPFLGGLRQSGRHFPEANGVGLRYPNLFALKRSVWHGDISYFPRSFISDYYRMGLGHVIALSGQHVAVLVVLVNALLSVIAMNVGWVRGRLCFCRREIPWISAGALVFTSEGVPSALRAFAVVFALRWLRGIRRFSSPLQINCSAIALCLILDPGLFRNIGFFLSSVAVGLLTLVRATSDGSGTWKRYVKMSVLMPLVLFPIQAFYFSRWAPSAMVASLCFGWIWDIVWIPLGFIFPILEVLPLTQFLEGCDWFLGRFLANPAEIQSWLAASDLVTVRPTWWEAASGVIFIILCIRFTAAKREID